MAIYTAIQSMTGFARCEQTIGQYRIAWQIKSVNNRYLDLVIRLPDRCSALEIPARHILKTHFGRGSLECRLNLTQEPSAASPLELNLPMVRALLDLGQHLRMIGNLAGQSLTLDRILSWPGVVCEQEIPQDENFSTAVLSVLEQTVALLTASRCAEGNSLVISLTALLNELTQFHTLLTIHLPHLREDLSQRLHERMASLSTEVVIENWRIAQELTFLLNRMEIGEELDRLQAHILAAHQLLEQGGQIGRKLDFLCQEMNRETNTLCAKSQDQELTRLGVEMKVTIEKFREQTQNLE